MAHESSTTTNNSDEYHGQVQGPEQAKHSDVTPLHVIGEIFLVLTKLHLYRSPRKSQLAELDCKARALADDATFASWAYQN